MSDNEQQRDPKAQTPAGDGRHTEEGAPTDVAHEDAGDGSLSGSTPAGLTRDQLLERARDQDRDDPGSE